MRKISNLIEGIITNTRDECVNLTANLQIHIHLSLEKIANIIPKLVKNMKPKRKNRNISDKQKSGSFLHKNKKQRKTTTIDDDGITKQMKTGGAL